MNLEVDLLLDRRRLKRRLFFWRTAAVAAVVACALLVAGDRVIPGAGGAYIARVSISGVITDDRKLTETIRDLVKDTSAKALILRIDSPGGSVAGGETLHAALSEVAAKIPVVAVMGGTAASAGYMIAMPATRVFARASTITGSIGVILETGEASGLLAKIGLSAEAITSGPLKDQPSFTKPLSAPGREVLHGLVMDMYDQFVGMVAAGRHMDPARVRELADGRAYSGRQAEKLGLIDAIGGEPEGRAWLASNRNVAADLPVHDLKRGSWSERMLGDSADGATGLLLKTVLSQGVRLDGAVALWQPLMRIE